MEKSCIWNFEPIIKERELPKSWEEFCEMFPFKKGECYIDDMSNFIEYIMQVPRKIDDDKNLLPDRATAEAVLALCQLTQLRNAYNSDWVPDWTDSDFKFMIEFRAGEILCDVCRYMSSSPLYFKTVKLRDEFLRRFRPLIEKLKPLYGIIYLTLKNLKSMKKKVRKMSDMQKRRIIDKNRKVFWRLHKTLDIRRRNAVGKLVGPDVLPIVNFTPLPMSFANFGAYMANTRTHKRNNK